MASEKVVTPEMNELLRQTASYDYNQAINAQREVAKALTLPLKQGVLRGDIVGGIFSKVELEPGANPEFPLDFLSPGTEKDFVAYVIPNVGQIPQKNVEGDYVMVPTYDIGASIDWALKYARDARWDVVGRAMQVLEGSFTRKLNGDGFHTVLAAGKNRNIVIYDDAATAGLFTKRLIALMQTSMRRNAGGNSTSVNRGKLTDLYQSPESVQDARSWDLTQVDEVTRREIFIKEGENPVTRIFGVNVHDIDELGVGQEYQLYYANTLAGTMPTDKVEIVVGLDLSKDDCFYMPQRAPMQLFEDPTLHRARRSGLYGWMEIGFAVLDSRRCLLGAV